MTQPTDRPGIDDLTSDQLDALYARLSNAERELARLTDMAIRYSDRAIENGERAERAEATLTAVRELHQRYRFAGDDTTDYCARCNQISGGWIPWPCPTTRLLDQHGQTPKETT